MEPYYAGRMSGSALPLRILYAAVATPVAAIGGFYAGMLFLTRLQPALQGLPPADPGWSEFIVSVMVAAALGFTAFLLALTLPWWRMRRRRGRRLRIAVSALLVLSVSVIAAAEAVPVALIAGTMAWMSVVLTFTFIRYGLRDRVRSGTAESGVARAAQF